MFDPAKDPLAVVLFRDLLRDPGDELAHAALVDRLIELGCPEDTVQFVRTSLPAALAGLRALADSCAALADAGGALAAPVSRASRAVLELARALGPFARAFQAAGEAAAAVRQEGGS